MPGLHEPSCALVIETNNLRGPQPQASLAGRAGGGGDVAAVVDPLEQLLRHLAKQTRPLATLEALVITHDGLPAEARARLEAAAGVALTWVEVAPGTGYYEAKNAGFAATRADVVAFADGDCWPQPQWLERLLAPFAETPRPPVVAGRTTYRDDLLGIATTTIDFMYYDSPLGADAVRNFYANNVAFRRDVFERHAYVPARGIYRGHCQVLGMDLFAAGVPIKFVPEARTIHRFPDRARDFVKLRLHRGADAREMAPRLARAVLPRSARWLGSLGPVSAVAVLAPRLVHSQCALGHQDMPRQRRRDRLATRALIGAISALDLVGGLIGNRGKQRSNENLGYQAMSDAQPAA